jgi:hypothetical protein
VIHTSEGLQAQRAMMTPLTLPAGTPQRINPNGPRHALEVSVWPEQALANTASEVPAGGSAPEDGSGEIDPGEDV